MDEEECVIEIGNLDEYARGVIGPTGRVTPTLGRVCYCLPNGDVLRGEVGLVRSAEEERALARTRRVHVDARTLGRLNATIRNRQGRGR